MPRVRRRTRAAPAGWIPDAVWPTRRSPWVTVYLAVCVVLAALNLRTLFSSAAAILPELTDALGLTAGQVTLLSWIPVLLVGLLSPLGAWLLPRLGTWPTLLAALVLVSLGLGLRGLDVAGLGLAPLWAGTVLCGAGVAVGNVTLPVVVKMDFPQRMGLMSGVYTMVICLSAALAAAMTVPVYEATAHEWHRTLGFWAYVAAVALLLVGPALWAVRGRVGRVPSRWVVRPPRRDEVSESDGGPERAVVEAPAPAEPTPSPWTSRTAWHLTALMACQAVSSFAVFAWMAPILRDRGLDASTAGVLVFVCIAAQMLGSLIVPVLAARRPSQSGLSVVCALLTGLGFVLVIVGPLGLAAAWALMLGLGQGGLTAVALTMIGLRSADAAMAGRVSAMMQFLGYALGSFGTLAVGQLYAVTGSYAPSAVLFGASGLAAAGFGWLAGRDRIVHVREGRP